MIDRNTIREHLRKTALTIISQETWPIVEAAQFLGYARNTMDANIDRWNWHVIRPGGLKQVYALDILCKFEEIYDVEFTELKEEWYKTFKIKPDKIPVER